MIKFPKGLTSYLDIVGAPLRLTLFRRIFFASLLSNFGMLIQGVGAAWAMTEMTHSAQMVALVQTAGRLPMMLLSLPAGAVADMYDRRIVSLIALSFRRLGGAGGTRPSGPDDAERAARLLLPDRDRHGAVRPGLAGLGERAGAAEALPSAIALNSINYNIARSFGPAIGGVIVAPSARSPPSSPMRCSTCR